MSEHNLDSSLLLQSCLLTDKKTTQRKDNSSHTEGVKHCGFLFLSDNWSIEIVLWPDV